VRDREEKLCLSASLHHQKKENKNNILNVAPLLEHGLLRGAAASLEICFSLEWEAILILVLYLLLSPLNTNNLARSFGKSLFGILTRYRITAKEVLMIFYHLRQKRAGQT
jgi:hypothetical protein